MRRSDLEFYIGPTRLGNLEKSARKIQIGELDEGAVESGEFGKTAGKIPDPAVPPEILTALGLPLDSDLDTVIGAVEGLRDLDPDSVQVKLREMARVVDELAEQVEQASRLKPSPGALQDLDALVGVSEKIIDFPGAKPVAVLELASAAGDGSMALDETPKTYAYFRESWMGQRSMDPERCRIIGVRGGSMEPTLFAGDSLLVDFQRRRRLAGHVFVMRTEDGVIVKRLGRAMAAAGCS